MSLLLPQTPIVADSTWTTTALTTLAVASVQGDLPAAFKAAGGEVDYDENSDPVSAEQSKAIFNQVPLDFLVATVRREGTEISLWVFHTDRSALTAVFWHGSNSTPTSSDAVFRRHVSIAVGRDPLLPKFNRVIADSDGIPKEISQHNTTSLASDCDAPCAGGAVLAGASSAACGSVSGPREKAACYAAAIILTGGVALVCLACQNSRKVTVSPPMADGYSAYYDDARDGGCRTTQIRVEYTTWPDGRLIEVTLPGEGILRREAYNRVAVFNYSPPHNFACCSSEHHVANGFAVVEDEAGRSAGYANVNVRKHTHACTDTH